MNVTIEDHDESSRMTHERSLHIDVLGFAVSDVRFSCVRCPVTLSIKSSIKASVTLSVARLSCKYDLIYRHSKYL